MDVVWHSYVVYCVVVVVVVVVVVSISQPLTNASYRDSNGLGITYVDDTLHHTVHTTLPDYIS